MSIFKKIWGLRNLRLGSSTFAWAVALVAALVSKSGAETCVAPIRPYVPSDPHAVAAYVHIIRKDFEFYIQDFQDHFRCLDEERARAFDEARNVSEEYGWFMDAKGQ